MPHSVLATGPIILLGLLLLARHSAVAVDVKYCSNLNTGSDFDLVSNIWQSNGACFDTCKETYAFAVLQGSKCWCSDYVPGDTTSSGDCNDPCPGYPDDKCGSPSDDLFGYIALDKEPSGTRGGSSPSPTSTRPSSTTQSPSSSSSSAQTSRRPSSKPSSSSSSRARPTTTETPTTSSTPSSTLTPSTSPEPKSSPPTTTWTPTPVTSVMTITGQLRTVTITPTEPPKANMPLEKSDGRFFSNAGKVAGLFVGLALIILIVAAAVLYLFWRRHQRALGAAAAAGSDHGSHQSPMRSRSRSMSELGLISRNSTLMGEKSVPQIQTVGPSGTMGAPVSPTSPLDKRSSQARIVDQRLDPGLIWNPLHDNSSRISVRSLQDDQDYSRRVLRLANPDSSVP
ncbi:MAG: hypothetical protein M1837_004540 [Sclerophora amabilis]|nr:MAG: hypothetical protein M1837_004540 [Sclerophora amabilis]